jgi:hypothetical protein
VLHGSELTWFFCLLTFDSSHVEISSKWELNLAGLGQEGGVSLGDTIRAFLLLYPTCQTLCSVKASGSSAGSTVEPYLLLPGTALLVLQLPPQCPMPCVLPRSGIRLFFTMMACPQADGTSPFTILTVDFFFFFLRYWGLNSGLHTCEAGGLPLEPLCQPYVCGLLAVPFV